MTGSFANDRIHFDGPLAGIISNEMSDQPTELHGIVQCHFAARLGYVVAVFVYLFVSKARISSAPCSLARGVALTCRRTPICA